MVRAVTRVTTGHQLRLASFWFGISFLWGSFLALVLPFLLVPEHPGPGNPALVPAGEKNTALALLEGAGVVVAMVVQPAAGALSDRMRGRFGRRRPLLAVGVLGGVVSLCLMSSIESFWLLVGVYCLLQVGMNTGQGAYQGLMPDTVPPEQFGTASGFVGLLTLLGQVAGTLVGGFVPPRLVTYPIAAVVAATAAITVLGVRERPAAAPPHSAREPGMRAGLRGYLAELRAYPDFCWVVASRFLIYTGLACIQRFAANYLRDNFSEYSLFGIVSLHSAQAATGVVAGMVILAGAAACYPAARLSEQVGRRRMVVTAALFGALASSLFFLGGPLSLIVVDAIPLGLAFGILASVDWAYMADLAPRRRAGKFLGFSNVATAGSQAFAPFLMGPVIDVVNARSARAGYQVLFVVAAAFFIAGAVLLRRVRIQRLHQEADEAAHVAWPPGDAALDQSPRGFRTRSGTAR